MGDLAIRKVPLGEVAGTVTVEVSCPRCGRAVRAVAQDDPRGYSLRERKLVLECVGETCRWAGAFVGELVDLGTKRGDWRPV